MLFETKSNGADYEIYYIPVRDGVPSNDESEWKSVASGKVAYSGYQSVDANGFVAPPVSYTHLTLPTIYSV